jgi:putative transposase
VVAAVHYGRAEELHAERQRILAAAFAAKPERFVKGMPDPPTLPSAAWINKPTTDEVAH